MVILEETKNIFQIWDDIGRKVPFAVRRQNWDEKYYAVVEEIEIMSHFIKCNFCMERIDEGLSKGLKPGIGRDATPVCVNACPVKARTFGDLDDPNSNVSKLIKERKGYQLHPEHGTDPSVYYLD